MLLRIVGMRDSGDEENSVKVVSDTVLGDNPTYGGCIEPHTELKELSNEATGQSEDNHTAPNTASTFLHNASDRPTSLTISDSHSYEYITTRHTDYRGHRESLTRDQGKGQSGGPIEESTESSGIYYSIEFNQSRRTGLQLSEIKPAALESDHQFPSSLIRTHSNTSIPQHYETMATNMVLSHQWVVSVDNSVTSPSQ